MRCVASPRVAASVPRVAPLTLSLSLSPSSINIRASTSTSMSRLGNALRRERFPRRGFTSSHVPIIYRPLCGCLSSRFWRPIRRSSSSADIGAPSSPATPGARSDLVSSGESPRIDAAMTMSAMLSLEGRYSYRETYIYVYLTTRGARCTM